MKIDSIKSQAFYSDFIISTLIFAVILVIYFAYNTNLSNQDSDALDDLLADSGSISSSFMSQGYPNNWNENNVVRIGFTDDGNRINNAKFNSFVNINYSKSKKLLGTSYDYFMFFLNESGGIKNVEGFCGTGNAEVNITYDISAAYYYQGPGNEDFLKDFMVNELKADVYTEDGTGGIGDYIALRDNRDNYGFIVLEAPEWSVGQFNDVDDEYEEWTDNGGLLMISGELVSGNKKPMVGADFEKISGLSSSNERATVVKEDTFLDFDIGDSLSFNQAFHAVYPSSPADPLASNYINISNFNESDIEFIDILDNKVAISRWEYGDGNVFFFSDFDATYFAGDFQEVLEASTRKWIGAMCLPINISNINREKLVKTERLLIYNDEMVKMVVYLWD